MRRRILFVVLGLFVAGAGAGAYFYFLAPRSSANAPLVLYGNVDVRQVNLSFKVPGRIAAMSVDEGDRVTPGQVVANLDRRYFENELAIAQAREATQEANVAKLEHGSRPEEIAQANANVNLARVVAENNRITFDRQANLLKTSVTSQQNFDNAQAAARQSDAQLTFAQAGLRLAQIGPRQEDIDAARAQLALERANVEVAKLDLSDAELVAPAKGTITTRSREPGAIVTAGEPIFTLTVDTPVWVRAYVGEADLGRIHPGMVAEVRSDLPGGTHYRATVGYISPIAEFTPKSVEAPELRTDLVYRLRIIVADPDENLRQGMPVTVSFDARAH